MKHSDGGRSQIGFWIQDLFIYLFPLCNTGFWVQEAILGYNRLFRAKVNSVQLTGERSVTQNPKNVGLHVVYFACLADKIESWHYVKVQCIGYIFSLKRNFRLGS